MAKTKTEKRTLKTTKKAKKMANGSSRETPEQLFATALTFVEQGQHEEALEKAQMLWTQVKDRGANEALPALNLLGEVNVELGDVDAARECFEKAVALDPDGAIPEAMGGGAEKFLWLAQLCEEGGKQSVSWFERGAKALQKEIATLEDGGLRGVDEESLLMMRIEKKRKLANALCGIVEVYMTDLSWEDDAENRCESLITEAMSAEDETSPEVLQTLASVRLSQQRKEDAQSALRRSIESWKDLDPEDPAVPDFATRISLSRLLMEADLAHDATEVLNRLVQEDDQSVEAWYLGGWCQHLMAEHETERATANGITTGNGGNPDENDVKATLQGSRHWLKTAMKLCEMLDYEDDRLFEHAKELVAGLDAVLGPENQRAEGGEDSEEEWAGIEEDGDVDEEMKDA